MLTLKEVRDYFKSLCDFDHYYVAMIDGSQTNVLGVYNRETGQNVAALNGCKKYDIKNVSFLIHGNKNASDTEELAFEFYETIKDTLDVQMGDTHVFYIMPVNNAPIDVGVDDHGIYEMVIQCDIYYERQV